jgi:hypothetical protein
LLCSRYSFRFSLNNWYMLNQIFRLFNNLNNIHQLFCLYIRPETIHI